MYQRKNGTWCDTVPRKGKSPKFFYSTSHDEKTARREIKQKIAAWTAEQEKGISVPDAIDEWYQEHENQITVNTQITYQAPIKKLKKQFSDVSLKELQTSDIQAYINSLAKKGYAKETVKLPLAVLKMVYDYFIAFPNSDIKYNPCSAVKVPSHLKSNIRDLPDPKIIEKIKNSVDVEFGLFAFLIIYTGLRRGEALALQYEDFSDTEITVSKTVEWKNDKPYIKEPKTQAGNRTVILLTPLKNVLPKWEGYLFSDDGGKTPLTQTSFFSHWYHYLREIGLAHDNGSYETKQGWHIKKWKYDVCPHQLRHEFATICFDAGLDPLDTKSLLGHSSEIITRRIYTHIKEQRKEKTNAMLEKYVTTDY